MYDIYEKNISFIFAIFLFTIRNSIYEYLSLTQEMSYFYLYNFYVAYLMANILIISVCNWVLFI